MKKLFLAALFLIMMTGAALGQTPLGGVFQQSNTVSSLVACSVSAGTTQTATSFPCGGAAPMYQNSLVTTHTITWTVTATVSACTIELEKSTDGVTWVVMTGTVVQTCTSSGSYSVTAQSFPYVRVNILSLTTSGSGNLQYTYNSNYPPILQLVSCSFTGGATSAAIQTVAQTSACVGLASGAYVFPVSVPAPTSLCPPTSYRVTADDVLSIYFSVLTAAACTPASGTYIMAVPR